MIDQLATATNRIATEIVEYREWQHVYFVRFTSGRPTFVSKKAVNLTAAPAPVIWTLRASTRREQRAKKWVARIVGTDATYGSSRQFLEADEIDWGRHGAVKCEYILSQPGYYHDSDGDYFEIFDDGNELGSRLCSHQEVRHHFSLVTA